MRSWSYIKAKFEDETLEAHERKKLNAIRSRGLPIQWVKGDADKAESSFFKINTKGTPLDSVEELLLKSRKRPISIAARAVIRAGRGHKYWSSFSPAAAMKIEAMAKELHLVLLEPELKRPIKTLDLPLGGSKGVRAALQILIDFILIASRDQNGKPKDVYGHPEDDVGEGTVDVLRRALKLAKRISGNDGGSLGLHPAIYFYGPSGRHSSPMFMGTVQLLSRKIINNDKIFFPKFTTVRERLEIVLVSNKDLIATVLQRHSSAKRATIYYELISSIVEYLCNCDENVTEAMLIEWGKLAGKQIVGQVLSANTYPNEDQKSKAFINQALSTALRCPICKGYLDPEKSASYDHIVRVRDGGTGDAHNIELTHPYCNQSIKN